MKACGILRVSFGFYTGLKFGLKYFQILRGALYIAVYSNYKGSTGFLREVSGSRG